MNPISTSTNRTSFFFGFYCIFLMVLQSHAQRGLATTANDLIGSDEYVHVDRQNRNIQMYNSPAVNLSNEKFSANDNIAAQFNASVPRANSVTATSKEVAVAKNVNAAKKDKLIPLVSAPTNLLMASETLPAGTLIIAMDQALQGNSEATLRSAYGLAVRLLHAGIPLKWIIDPNKTIRTAVDLSASARQRYPSIGTYATRNFKTGPLAIYPGFEAQAQAVINSYGNSIRVYELQSATVANINSDLTHKPFVFVEESDNPDIHTKILSAAGLTLGTHYTEGDLSTVNASSCVTIITVPHNENITTAQQNAIIAFLRDGGNFFAQCAAVRSFQSVDPRLFSNAGFIDETENNTNVYSNPQEPSAQFEGLIPNEGGSLQDLGFTNEPPGGTRIVHDGNQIIKAYAGRIDGTTKSQGGYVQYLGGHNHDGDIDSDRFYLNAVLRSAIRPTNCGLNLGPVAQNDQGTVNLCGESVTIDVRSNDSDPVGGAANLVVSLPNGGIGAHGTFVRNNDNTITYTLTDDFFSGSDEITYRVCNATNQCATAKVIITSSAARKVAGTVFVDANTDGTNQTSEVGQDGVIVKLYQDTNGNGQLDSGEPQVGANQTTSNGGQYNFNINTIPNFGQTVTISNRTISSSADDSYQVNNGSNVTNNVETSQIRFRGFRFPNLNIPANAVITSATLTVTGYREGGESAVIKAEDTNAPGSYTSATNYLSTRPTTTQSRSWSIPAGNGANVIVSPDFSNVVQQVVTSRSGLTHLSLIVNNTTDNDLELWNFDDGSTYAARRAKLNLTYTVPGNPERYVVVVDPSSLPAGATFTTDNVEVASFTALGQLDCDNNFGIRLATIDAVDDNFTGTTITTAGGTTPTVFTNDNANGTTPATNALLTTPTIVNNGGLNGVTISSTGVITVPANTPSGDYSVRYRICLTAATSICDEANVLIRVVCPIIPTPTGIVTVQPTCASPTGTIVFTAPSTGVEYSINGTTYQSSNTFTGVAPGSYTLRVRSTSSSTCIVIGGSVTVNPVPANPATPVVNVNCTLGFGQAVLTVTSPLGSNLEYSINNGLYQSSPTFSNVSNGTQTIRARDRTTGCVSAGATIDVNCGCVNGPTVTLSSTSGSTIGVAPVTITGNTFGGSATSVTITENGAGSVTPSSSGTNPFSFTYTPAAADRGNTVTITVTTNNPLGAPCQAAFETYTLTVIRTIDAVNDDFRAIPTLQGANTPTVFNNDVADGVNPATDLLIGTQSIVNNGGITGLVFNSDGTLTVPSTTPSGIYTVRYRICLSADNNVCDEADVLLNVLCVPLPLPTASVAVQPTCAVPTATIVVSSPVEGANVSYTLTGTNPVRPALTQSSSTFSGVLSGTYSLITTNTFTNCVSSAISLTVNAVPSAPITPTATVVQPTCAEPTGTIVFAPQSNVEYNIGNGYQTSNIFTNVSPGGYTLRVRTISDNSCVAVSPVGAVVVTNPPGAPLLSRYEINNVCPAATVDLNTITANNTPSGLIRTWHTSVPATTANRISGANVGDGTYYAAFFDASANCYGPASLEVVVNILPCCPTITNFLNNNNDPTTCSGTDGTIKICGLTPNQTGYVITFSRNSAAQSPRTLNADAAGCVVISGLGAGIYSAIQVTHPIDCPTGSNRLGPITLVGPAPAEIAKGNTQNTSACGAANGFIQITGLVLANDYILTYNKNGQAQTPIAFTANSTSYTIQNLTSGNYTDIRVQSSGCVSNSLFHSILDPFTPTINVTAQTNPTLCSANDGTFTVSGMAPGTYTMFYSKDGFEQTPIAFSIAGTSYTVFGLTRGTYTNIRVISNGCVSNSTNVSLSDPGAPIITLGTPNQPSACGFADGSITINGLNDGDTYKLRFRKDGIFQNPITFIANGSSYTLTGLNAAIYSNIYVDQGGCKSNSLQQVLKDPGGATIAIAGTNIPTICGANNGSITISGLTTGLQYILNYVYNNVQQAPSTFTATGTTYVLASLTAGSYTGINVTQGGCKSNSINLILNNPNGARIAADVIDAKTCEPSNDGQIIVTGLAQGVAYTLTYERNGFPQSPISITNTSTTSYVIGGLTPGTYSKIKVTQGGCVSNEAMAIVSGPILPPAPAVPTSLGNVCPAVTADLTSLIASNNTGLQLTWHTSPTASNSSLIPDPEDVGAGTYYAAFYNSFTKCYGSTTAVIVTITSCLPPVAMNDVAVTPINIPVSGNVLTNDSDPQGSPLTVTPTPTQFPSNGTVTLSTTGVYIYTPNNGFVGEDTFCYEITNGFGLTDVACVVIDVIPTLLSQNNPPIAVDDNTETVQNTGVTIVILANDSDPDDPNTPNGTLGTPTKTSDPTNGTVIFNTNGTITYTPTNGFVGTDMLTYQVCDNGNPSLCDDAVVRIIVKPTPPAGNRPPVAVDDANLTLINTPVSGTVAANDSDPDNTPAQLTFTKLSDPVNGNVVFNPNGTYTYTPGTDFVGNVNYTYKVCDPGGKCDTATVHIAVLPLPIKVTLLPKVYLQGALYGVSSPNTLMRDDLRVKGLLPLTSPYPALGLNGITSTGNVNASVFSAIGQDAIVDWVFVELRDAGDPTIVLDSREGLVQRDGDIVDLDGTSALTFDQAVTGSYYVAIKHRNHLGVMSQTAIALSSIPAVVDFRDGSTVAYILANNVTNVPLVVVDQGLALWAGNTLYDNRIIYQGTSNDVNPIYDLVLNDVSNIFDLLQFKLKTYNNGDVNMNGETIFQGTGNDLEFIYQNIIQNHPGNALKVNFFIIKEQLP